MSENKMESPQQINIYLSIFQQQQEQKVINIINPKTNLKSQKNKVSEQTSFTRSITRRGTISKKSQLSPLSIHLPPIESNTQVELNSIQQSQINQPMIIQGNRINPQRQLSYISPKTLKPISELIQPAENTTINLQKKKLIPYYQSQVPQQKSTNLSKKPSIPFAQLNSSQQKSSTFLTQFQEQEERFQQKTYYKQEQQLEQKQYQSHSNQYLTYQMFQQAMFQLFEYYQDTLKMFKSSITQLINQSQKHFIKINKSLENLQKSQNDNTFSIKKMITEQCQCKEYPRYNQRYCVRK